MVVLSVTVASGCAGCGGRGIFVDEGDDVVVDGHVEGVAGFDEVLF